MSAPPEQSEARKRADARKAKILARGNTGLNKLASTARGEEASTLYDTSTPSRPSTPTAATTTATHLPPQPPRTAASFSSAPQDPAQQYNQQLEQMMSMLGGGGGGGMPEMSGPGAGGGADAQAFQNMMAQMLGGAGGGFGGMGSENLLTDVDPTADPPSPTIPSANPFSALGSMNTDMFSSVPPAPVVQSFAARVFPLVHVLAVLLFWVGVVAAWEPSVRTAKMGEYLGALGGWGRWGVMGRDGLGVVRGGGLAKLPVFWAFTTLELILQTTRFMILKVPPPSPSFLSPFLPMLPPQLSSPILAVLRYVHLANQVWKDGCLVMGLYGATVLWGGGWK